MTNEGLALGVQHCDWLYMGECDDQRGAGTRRAAL